MSDQETNDTAESSLPVKADQPAVEKAPPPVPRKSSSGVAWLAILLIFALAGGAYWVLMEAQGREAILTDRLAELEAAASQKDDGLENVAKNLQGSLKSGLDDLQAAVDGETVRLTKGLETLEAQMLEQRAELASFNASDRDSWMMAEAEYLLRLANQRLIMAGDTVAAQALLSSADNVLRELDDVTLLDVRGAVAADLAAVRAVQKVDVDGIYLRLAALIDQAGGLVIFQLPEAEAVPAPVAADDWQGRLQQGYESALRKLSDYIIVRRRDVPMQTLMDPQWEGLVRQNLRMLLEQAQVALLSGNQTLYSESLSRAQHWVAEFLASDEAAAAAIGREITQLGDLNIQVTLPDTSRSLLALDNAIERRLEQGGGE